MHWTLNQQTNNYIHKRPNRMRGVGGGLGAVRLLGVPDIRAEKYRPEPWRIGLSIGGGVYGSPSASSNMFGERRWLWKSVATCGVGGPAARKLVDKGGRTRGSGRGRCLRFVGVAGILLETGLNDWQLSERLVWDVELLLFSDVSSQGLILS